MNLRFARKLLILYPLLMLLCGIGYAKYDNYQIDGDAIAFMDIADAIHVHNWPVVVNGYWNPGYAAALAVGQVIAHPTRWNELQTYCYVNFFVFLCAIVACLFFVQGLVRLRSIANPGGDDTAALSPTALMLASLGLLFFSFQRELSLGKVRSDALLLVWFFLAAGLLLRLQTKARFSTWPLLGAVLGFAYLTKSFAFLPSGFLLLALLIYGITRKSVSRRTITLGSITAGIVFAVIAAPYIHSISKQAGHLTTGESARMNYCFFIDHTPRWHEWHHHDLGHAVGAFKHPEIVLSDNPNVYSYANHAVGTYPLWFDPSYYTAGLKPHIWLKGHTQRIARCAALLLRFFLEHPESFVFFLALLGMGAIVRRSSSEWRFWIPVLGWGVLMFAIYFPIDLQDRYLTGAFLLVVLPILAALRKPATGYAGQAATAAAVLLALLALADATRDIASRRREESVAGYPRGSYSLQVFPAAKGLAELGVLPGDKVVCMGDEACYVDQYWARLSGTQILDEVEVPHSGNPAAFWSDGDNAQRIVSTLAPQPVKAIVAVLPVSASQPAGWKQLGASNYYAYLLH
jgi:hypothetical protein